MTGLIWSFAPWMGFLLGVRVGNVWWGAAIGLVLAIVVLVRAQARKKVHLFDVVGVVYFAGMLALLAALDPSNLDTWGRYAQAVAHGSLTVIVFASVLIGRPFTEPYAREQVPQQFWGSPQFRSVNRKISLVFGLAFLVGTISMIIAGATDSRPFILRIVVPFGALFLAFLHTQRTAGSDAAPVPAG